MILMFHTQPVNISQQYLRYLTSEVITVVMLKTEVFWVVKLRILVCSNYLPIDMTLMFEVQGELGITCGRSESASYWFNND
jgi:hypothetical protein